MRKDYIAAVGGVIFTLAAQASLGASPDYKRWLKEAFPTEGPGAAVILVRNNKILFRDAVGLADLELAVPLTPDNVFRIGSITKQFTAAGILLLEEQGKLSVNDEISRYLPNYPTQGHTITIEHLLTHSSGIHNYTDIPGYFDGVEIRKDVSIDELIGVFANLPMDFAPGEAFNYSNSGYVLLGAIIERVSGQSYAEFMQTALFDKLGLHHSYHGGQQIVPNRAHGYRSSDGDYTNAAYLSMTQPHAAGALLSTVDDLARWTQALFGGELLSKASLKKMTRDHKLNNGEHAGYAYGFHIDERFGELEISHNGGIHGFSTSGIWLPGPKVYAVVLANSEDNRVPDFLAARMAFDAAGADFPRLEKVEISKEKISDYLGVYQINERETRTVLFEEGRVFTQRTGGGRTQIVPHGQDAFFYPGSFTHLKFKRDRSGRVVAMDMYQGGADKAEQAKRISEVVERERKAVKVSAEIYDLWAGNYALDSGVTLQVRRAGDQLFVQMAGQPEFEVFPASPTRYFLKSVDAEIEFSAGDDGRAWSLVIFQGGNEQSASRVE